MPFPRLSQILQGIHKMSSVTDSYNAWKKKRDEKMGGKSVTPSNGTQQEGHSWISTSAGGTTDRVASYNQMRRLTSTKTTRAPSLVGSVRSIRSVQTTEEQIENLEQRMQGVEEAQKETNRKIDQIIQLLKEGKK